VEHDYAPSIELDWVPVTANFLIVKDLDQPLLMAKVPVKVVPGTITYATDIVLRPQRPEVSADGFSVSADALAATDTVNPGSGKGYIQKSPYMDGRISGSSAQVAGGHAISVTSSMNYPYQTNTWVSPLMMADNHSKIYLGADPKHGHKYGSWNPQTLYQHQIYPLPWAIWYNMNDATSTTKPTTGLLISPISPGVMKGTQVPAPDGTNTKHMQAVLDSRFTKATMKIDPGFSPSRMKVNRQGDYDAEFYLRAADDPNIGSSGAGHDALLKVAVVRGSPFMFFTAVGILNVKLNCYPKDTVKVTNKNGTITISGVEINYAVIHATMNALYPQGDNSIPKDGNIPVTAVLFYPKAAANYTPSDGSLSTLSFTSASGPNYFVLAALPSEDFNDDTAITALAQAAFSYPTGSTVTYTYDKGSQTVTAMYKLATTNVLKLPEDTVQGILPHHYGNLFNKGSVFVGTPSYVKNQSGTDMVFTTVRGDLKVISGSTFSCKYQYPGILPFMPDLEVIDSQGNGTTDTEGVAQLKKWVKDVFVVEKSGTKPPYTELNVGVGQDSYNAAKILGRDVIAARAAEVAGESAVASEIYKNVRDGIALYFRQDPKLTQMTDIGQAPMYTLYDHLMHTLLLYPCVAGGNSPNFPSDNDNPPWDGFGTISRLNDHHFHYGYFIYAAALASLNDPDGTWANDYKSVINQLVFDVANDPTVNTSPALAFPKMRNWDAYMNHALSGGLTFPDNMGNNQESVSEEINFWAGVILWGTASGQPAVTELGIKYFTCAVSSSWVYWMDVLGMYKPLIEKIAGSGYKRYWPGEGMTLLYDGQANVSTFFNCRPLPEKGITRFPITPACFYHAMDTQYIEDNVDALQKYLKDYDIDPLKPNGLSDFFDPKNPWAGSLIWYSNLAKYYAMGSPSDAMLTYYNYEPVRTVTAYGNIVVDLVTDPGDTGAAVYHFSRYLETHGKPDPFTYTGDTPYYMTFEDSSGTKTYVAYNPDDTAKDISFNDGTVIGSVPAKELKTKIVK